MDLLFRIDELKIIFVLLSNRSVRGFLKIIPQFCNRVREANQGFEGFKRNNGKNGTFSSAQPKERKNRKERFFSSDDSHNFSIFRIIFDFSVVKLETRNLKPARSALKLDEVNQIIQHYEEKDIFISAYGSSVCLCHGTDLSGMG